MGDEYAFVKQSEAFLREKHREGIKAFLDKGGVGVNGRDFVEKTQKK